jgi:threonyl-tRNA synthetase
LEEATAPDLRRAQAVAETVPTSDTVLDGHHVEHNAP